LPQDKARRAASLQDPTRAMTSPLAWSPALATGIGVIDDQHQQLLARAGEVLESLARGEREVIERALAYLASYAKFHFAEEEAHMLRLGYPRLDDHRAEHGDYVRRLRTLQAHFDGEGDSDAVSTSIDSLLSTWLLDHIGRVDRHFAEYARTAGSGG
jgi:hemerythrin